MLYVQHNLLAQNANRQLKASTDKNAKTTEKLSSGYRINRAADDAAGLSISEKMRRQVRGLHQTVDNISEGVGYVQTAEGALNEVQDMLQRINELAVKAANGTNTNEDRLAIDQEVQQLKNEMNRIFGETAFNEKKIWYPGDQKLLGYYKKQAVEYPKQTAYYDITNANCDVIASSGYHIEANDDGVLVSWNGYNGKSYATERIGWDYLEENHYSFSMGEHFDPKFADLRDSAGSPLFDFKISMNVHDMATREDIIAAINSTTRSSGVSVYMSARLEDAAGNAVNKTWQGTNDRVYFSASLNYKPAYDSNKKSPDGYDFDMPDDKFMEPVLSGGTNLKYPGAATVDAAKTSSEKWTFSFYMEGIGNVTAESDYISYASPDRDEGSEGIWWDWYDPKDGRKPWQSGNGYTVSGTLGGAMSALTGTTGLLGKGQGGNTINGGSMTFHFTLRSGSDTIGSISTTMPIKTSVPPDTEQSVLDRIRDVFNGNTILDLYTDSQDVTTGTNGDYGVASWTSTNKRLIDVPIYGGTCSFYVQAGTEGGQHIDIKYEALSTIALGMENTNTRTIESAGSSINEVRGALQIVSEQRSAFGAYQNRLEHAQNINANVEENTQSAESLIRDTDIADTMLEYSINNILMQAGTSMLTQANQSKQSILELLQ